MDKTISGVPLTYGQASGEVLFLDEPISFWGGVDLEGVIADERHPQYKANSAGKVLVMTSSRGSSSGSFCLMELMRKNLAPVAIVITEPDGVICTGVLVGKETFGMDLPVIEVKLSDLAEFKTGQNVTVTSRIDHAEAIIKAS
jgi:predicted aconitase with swiveling domain